MDRNLKKKFFCKSQINLPFPYPMLDSDNKTTRWPFKEEGFLIAEAKLNVQEKFVEINDLATIVVFNKMGFFGIHSSREIIPKSFTKDSKSSDRIKQKSNRFTVGYYYLKPVNLSPALKSFPNDLNKLKSTEEDSPKESPENFHSLKLSLEEAYFLSYVFGILKIIKNDQKEFYNLNEQWECFCRALNSEDWTEFASRFAAYYFFRSKGFVVKNGFKFGVDYLLYEDGPPFNHSLYSVLVHSKFQSNHEQPEQINYNELSSLTRISKSSCKDFLLCTVIIPNTETIMANMINGPKCIKYFKIDIIQIDRRNLTKQQPSNLTSTKHLDKS